MYLLTPCYKSILIDVALKIFVVPCLAVEKVNDSERLRPEELNQQNIEALVAESNLVMHF